MRTLESYKVFHKIGAELSIPVEDFRAKAKKANMLLFDWDGVFHSGTKTEQNESTFSEKDSMGINMLRFGFYLRNYTQIPTFILTGENNHTAAYFAKREHLHGVFFGIKDKSNVVDYLQKHYKTDISDGIFIFDDILDLSLAALCGLRLMVTQSANPLFQNFVKKGNYTDYITAHNGKQNALRECSELLLESLGCFEQTTKERIAYSDNYKNYLKELHSIKPGFFTLKGNNNIEPIAK